MEKITLDLPAMFGDHHVTEVRNILLALPGVTEVYASSGFQCVEISYDPAQLEADAIKNRLDEAGYLEPLVIPLEPQLSPYQDAEQTAFFRHSAAYQQTGKTVGFTQSVANTGRPLWPCPGMGPLKNRAEEK